MDSWWANSRDLVSAVHGWLSESTGTIFMGAGVCLRRAAAVVLY